MREKTEKSKLKEGRGLLPDGSYKAWKRANESKSVGVSSMFYDPVSGLSMDALSQGEMRMFWILRYSEKVKTIYMQFPLDPDGVAKARKELGMRQGAKILSTDLLAEFKDGSCLAISIKAKRDELTLEDGDLGFMAKERNEKRERVIRRQAVEKRYWENLGVPFKIIFTEDIPEALATNSRICFGYWDASRINSEEGLLKHMIAHHIIEIKQMDQCNLPYRKITKDHNVREMYENYKNKGTTYVIDLGNSLH